MGSHTFRPSLLFQFISPLFDDEFKKQPTYICGWLAVQAGEQLSNARHAWNFIGLSHKQPSREGKD